jgi:glutamine synthetase adenylyltransferase
VNITASVLDFDALLQKTLRGSRYAQRLLIAAPEFAAWLREHCATPCSAAEMAQWLAAMPAQNEAELSRALRQF